MPRSTKKARHITVGETSYLWRAKGDDYLSVNITIWPADGGGPCITCSLPYGGTWIANGDGSRTYAGDQIVVTNRLIRRILEFVVAEHSYDPNGNGGVLGLGRLESEIDVSDAVRAGQK